MAEVPKSLPEFDMFLDDTEKEEEKRVEAVDEVSTPLPEWDDSLWQKDEIVRNELQEEAFVSEEIPEFTPDVQPEIELAETDDPRMPFSTMLSEAYHEPGESEINLVDFFAEAVGTVEPVLTVASSLAGGAAGFYKGLLSGKVSLSELSDEIEGMTEKVGYVPRTDTGQAIINAVSIPAYVFDGLFGSLVEPQTPERKRARIPEEARPLEGGTSTLLPEDYQQSTESGLDPDKAAFLKIAADSLFYYGVTTGLAKGLSRVTRLPQPRPEAKPLKQLDEVEINRTLDSIEANGGNRLRGLVRGRRKDGNVTPIENLEHTAGDVIGQKITVVKTFINKGKPEKAAGVLESVVDDASRLKQAANNPSFSAYVDDMLRGIPEAIKPSIKDISREILMNEGGFIEGQELKAVTSALIHRSENLVKSLKKMEAKIDIEAPFKQIGADETGFSIKNYYSQRDMFEQQTIEMIKRITDKKLKREDYTDIAMVAENPAEIINIANPKNAKLIQEKAAVVRNYFDDSFKELKDVGGLERPFPESFIRRVREENAKLRSDLQSMQNKSGPRATDIRETIKANKKLIKEVEGKKFVHLPTSIWFDQAQKKSPREFMNAMTQLTAKKRKTPTIRSLMDEGIIKRGEFDIRDVIANYGRRKGKDIAALKIMRAAEKDELITTKAHAPGFVSLPAYNYPMLSKYKMHPMFADYLHEYFSMGRKMNTFEKALAGVKGFQFYNPLILPFYDAYQGLLIGSFRSIKTPSLLKDAVKQYGKRSPEYWEALENGLASKPFNNPFSNWSRMVEQAKTPISSRMFGLLKPKLKNLAEAPRGLYDASHYLAWEMDKVMRFTSYKYLRGQGYNPRDAAQIAARYHSDYASVPPALRRTLNKIFFTPTFKVTMGKAWGEMVKAMAQKPIDVIKYYSDPKFRNLVKTDPKAALKFKRTKTAFNAALSLLVVNQAFDTVMRGYGFEPDQWGRRYTKTLLTDEGEKEAVVTLSHPANMFFKYIFRAMEAAQPGGDPFFKEMLDKNRYELHPFYRILMLEAAQNRDTAGKQIWSPGDSNAKKAVSGAAYIAKQIFRISSVLEENEDDRKAKRAIDKQFGKVTGLLLRPFVFTYLREGGNKDVLYRLRTIKKSTSRDAREGELIPSRMRNYQEQLEQLTREID